MIKKNLIAFSVNRISNQVFTNVLNSNVEFLMREFEYTDFRNLEVASSIQFSHGEFVIVIGRGIGESKGSRLPSFREVFWTSFINHYPSLTINGAFHFPTSWVTVWRVC